MRGNFLYKINSGKPNKMKFFVLGYLKSMVPSIFFQKRLNHVLETARKRDDYEYILKRVDYYIKLNAPFALSEKDEIRRGPAWIHYRGPFSKFTPKMFHSAYYLDQLDVTRWFPQHLRWDFCPGDVYFTPPCPCIVKSRLLTEDNSNSVILKLDKLRHFLFVHDRKSFREKQDKVIFRGKIRSSRVRTAFLKKFINHPVFDCGVVESREDVPKEWERPKRTIREHLDYKFIMALEGNDVASNLKWVMSSNCLAVMTRPTCETWFMEGSLIAGYHYVEVKEDFSDLEEKIRYYTEHIQEAEDIIAHAHEYVSQFMDKEREEIIQLLVLQKYLRLSGQY